MVFKVTDQICRVDFESRHDVVDVVDVDRQRRLGDQVRVGVDAVGAVANFQLKNDLTR